MRQWPFVYKPRQPYVVVWKVEQMFLTRSIAVLACTAALLAGGVRGQPQEAPAKPAPHASSSVTIDLPRPSKPVLPDAFAGWVADQQLKIITDPAQACPYAPQRLG